MLISFSVTNFRSIRERQGLSLIANNKEKGLAENLHSAEIPGLKGARAVKSAVIYGPNASGKTNVLRAVEFLRDFVLESATERKPGQSTGVVHFKLDTLSQSQPTELRIVFMQNDVRYDYGVALNSDRVLSEYLTAYPKKSPQRWFERTSSPDSREGYEWSFSNFFVRQRDLEARTRENALFLSVCAQFNHPQLTDVYNWFAGGLHVHFMSTEDSRGSVFPSFHIFPEYFEAVEKILQWADLGITGIKFEQPAASQVRLRSEGLPETEFRTTVIHRVPELKEPIAFDLEEESAGTRRLLFVLGPWLEAISEGATIFVDEMGASMHPILTKKLVQLINGVSSGSQLIFTTHDTTLLDQQLFRRDQIWFTERNKSSATELYSLSDFHPRKDESLAKGYLAGRYGAIPFLSGDVDLT